MSKSMIKGFIVMLLTLTLLLSLCVHIEVNAIDKDEFSFHLNERINYLMRYYDIPGVSIALIEEGEVVWVNAYGYADVEQQREMTTDTVCRVQSISKSVTAWGVLRLAEDGLIDLDSPVKKYINSWNFPISDQSYNEITVRQLLTHTSGLVLGDVMDQYPINTPIPSLRDNLTKEARFFQKPGQSFSYSNVGYNLLELMVEDVTSQTFEEFMSNEVLAPLKMETATFVWNEGINPEVPVGYNTKGEPVPVYVYPEIASGGLFASVEDIAHFVAAGMSDNPVLSSESLLEMYDPAVTVKGVYRYVSNLYGLGHFIEQSSLGLKAVWHGGQGNGLMTHFHAIPETGDGIVILTNSQRSWPMISYILRDWTEWNSYDSVGMSNIVYAIIGLQIVIGFIFLIVLWQLSRLILGVLSGSRKFTLINKRFRLRRLLQVTIFIVLSAVLYWGGTRDYLFLTSVFPVLSIWLGRAVLSVATVSLLSAYLPEHSNDNDVYFNRRQYLNE